VKRYDNVRVHFLKHASGRERMEAMFARPRIEDRKVSLEVADLIKTFPEGEAVLIFCHKPREATKGRKPAPDIPARLIADLRQLGIETEATVDVDGERKPRICIATWGQECSTSRWKHCSKVILAGVLHMADETAVGLAVGQRDDLLTPMDETTVSDVLAGEVAHRVYQALSRARMRETIDGQAKPTEAWIMHHDPRLKDALSMVLPGATWMEWETKNLSPLTEPVVSGLAERVSGYLGSLPEDVTRVSSRSVKKALGLTDLPRMTWTRTARHVSEHSGTWELDGQAFARVPAEAYGL
jgi:hypothetical protein